MYHQQFAFQQLCDSAFRVQCVPKNVLAPIFATSSCVREMYWLMVAGWALRSDSPLMDAMNCWNVWRLSLFPMIRHLRNVCNGVWFHSCAVVIVCFCVQHRTRWPENTLSMFLGVSNGMDDLFECVNPFRIESFMVFWNVAEGCDDDIQPFNRNFYRFATTNSRLVFNSKNSPLQRGWQTLVPLNEDLVPNSYWSSL